MRLGSLSSENREEWIAAIFRNGPCEFGTGQNGRDFRIDGSKGQALSFRSWDNQLRQPVQLATSDAVIAQAPLPQFLHPEENLDTLGYDRPESACVLREVAK